MTELDRLDRDLVVWFGEAATPRVPDYVDDIVRETAPIRQRPRWTFPERWLPMTVVTLGRRARRPVPWRTIGAIALVVVLLAAIVAVYVGTQRRLPSPFGLAANGSIAYVQTGPVYENKTEYHEPFGDIVTVDPATGRTNVLVGGPELDGEPVYSLDGSRLSFVRKGDAGVALYAIDDRGGGLVRLTRDALPSIREAAWSPDGRTVAFTVASGGRSDLWLARTDGSDAHAVHVGVSAVAPQWRPPDGSELLFVGSSMPGVATLGDYHGILGADSVTGLAIYRYRLLSGDLRPVGRPGGAGFDYGTTSWTPDGQRIVTQLQDTNGDVHVVVLDADGTEVSRFDAPAVGDSAMAPIVSPDGQRVAYAVIDTTDRWHVDVRSLDGTGRDLTFVHEFHGPAASMRWSPDAKRLIVNHHYDAETWSLDFGDQRARLASWADPGYTSYQRRAE